MHLVFGKSDVHRMLVATFNFLIYRKAVAPMPLWLTHNFVNTILRFDDGAFGCCDTTQHVVKNFATNIYNFGYLRNRWSRPILSSSMVAQNVFMRVLAISAAQLALKQASILLTGPYCNAAASNCEPRAGTSR